MKVRVKTEIAGRSIDETLAGANADDILAQVKSRVAKELGWKGLFLNAMTPLGFAQEAVKRYNTANQSSYAPPQSASEFVQLGSQLGFVEILPE
ncbi:MAG: hypothetical protein ABIY70_19630 [Capsulimonas sp.]|jgi:hypothetical protein|uniref:hypothetical protein n=1 Tax=Capsulimonas sp. TaxID=2494211 RepID=UPI0032636B99|nr:hypothetical protein [Capsulimonas sp.]